MRRVVAACACLACVATGVPTAVQARPAEELFASASNDLVPLAKLPDRRLERRYLRLHREAERAGADPGRNIVLAGVKGERRVRAATPSPDATSSSRA